VSLSIQAKSLFARAVGACGIPERRIRRHSGKRYLILMYHRIVPPEQERLLLQPGMYVEPRTFDAQVEYLSQHFRMVPFAEIVSPRSRPSERGRPSCILTFDDGWHDFYRYAYPVLARYGAPATVFLPTGFIGTGDWFWTDRLAWHMGAPGSQGAAETQGARGKSELAERIAGLHGSPAARLEAAIGLLKDRTEAEIEEAVEAIRREGNPSPVPDRRAFLNWEEIREMRDSGLVSYGSHTHSHRILVHLEDREVRQELILSRDTLLREGAVEPSFIPFCYPNGNWNERVAEIVRETGYHATVSTGSGWCDEGSSPFALKRVAIHQDMTGTRGMFGCRIAEIL